MRYRFSVVALLRLAVARVCAVEYSLCRLVDRLLSSCAFAARFLLCFPYIAKMNVMQRNPIFLASYSRCGLIVSEKDSAKYFKRFVKNVNYYPRNGKAWCTVGPRGVVDKVSCQFCEQVSAVFCDFPFFLV